MTAILKEISGVNFRVINELDSNIMETIEKNIVEPVSKGGSFASIPLEHLGEGSFGAVYAINDEIAVKVAFDPDDKVEDGKVLEELQGLPYIVKLYAYSEDNRFTVMQRIHGQTILGFASKPRFDIEEFNVTKESLREFYDKAKERGRTPWDCHGGNSMVDKDGNYWVVDLGFFRKSRNGDLNTLLAQLDTLEWALETNKARKSRESAPQEKSVRAMLNDAWDMLF